MLCVVWPVSLGAIRAARFGLALLGLGDPALRLGPDPTLLVLDLGDLVVDPLFGACGIVGGLGGAGLKRGRDRRQRNRGGGRSLWRGWRQRCLRGRWRRRRRLERGRRGRILRRGRWRRRLPRIGLDRLLGVLGRRRGLPRVGIGLGAAGPRVGRRRPGRSAGRGAPAPGRRGRRRFRARPWRLPCGPSSRTPALRHRPCVRPVSGPFLRDEAWRSTGAPRAARRGRPAAARATACVSPSRSRRPPARRPQRSSRPPRRPEPAAGGRCGGARGGSLGRRRRPVPTPAERRPVPRQGRRSRR